jgi:protein SCO1/2
MRWKPDPDPTQRLLLAAALGLLLLLVWGVAFGQALPADQPFDARAAIERSQQAIGRQLGDHTLVDTDGRPVRLAKLRGKPLVVSFVYTGCTQVCPTTTAFLARAVGEARRVVGDGTFNVVTIGFNVPFDSPAAMRDMQRRLQIDARGWTFLSGDAPTIEALARDVGFAWRPTASGFEHVTQATIVDAGGRVVRQVFGESFELPMLVAPLKELATGAPLSSLTLGDIVEQVRILCTVYDPRAGRYRFDYALAIEILAGVTFLGGTLAFLVHEWRRHRRLRPS